jgi:hypothetical protein
MKFLTQTNHLFTTVRINDIIYYTLQLHMCLDQLHKQRGSLGAVQVVLLRQHISVDCDARVLTFGSYAASVSSRPIQRSRAQAKTRPLRRELVRLGALLGFVENSCPDLILLDESPHSVGDVVGCAVKKIFQLFRLLNVSFDKHVKISTIPDQEFQTTFFNINSTN